jgi:RimJ/RimL family protein N-acetyltransferase
MASSEAFIEKPAVRIEAARLFLAPLREEHCTETYVAWLNDPAVSRFLETRHHVQTLESVRDFVSAVNARDNEHLFGIFLHEGRRHIGNIKVGPIHPYHRCADVSLFIGEKDCWGSGYASEAIVALSRYAFAELGVEKLCAGMYAPNAGSAKAFAKAGYAHEGVRRAQYMFEGKRCDIIIMGLCATGAADASDPARTGRA